MDNAIFFLEMVFVNMIFKYNVSFALIGFMPLNAINDITEVSKLCTSSSLS